MKKTKIQSASYFALLDELEATPSLAPLLETLIEKSLSGTFRYHRSLSHSLNTLIDEIDRLMSNQIKQILHNMSFSQLEGRWRGLHSLVKNTQSGTNLKIKLMHCTKSELANDFASTMSPDQSQLHKKIYTQEFGTPGGQPYAALVVDYEFDHQAQHVKLLTQLAQVAAAAFCPIISAVLPSLFGFKSWQELNKPHELSKLFDSIEYLAWNNFRLLSEARFIYLCLPRSLARETYGPHNLITQSFNFNEFESAAEFKNPAKHCWMSSAYHLANLMTKAFARYGWCINIRGSQGGGRVENLALTTFKSSQAEHCVICPTEIDIPDRREAELSQLGLLPLCHYKNTDYAVFFGAESAQKIPYYDKSEATKNAHISARLPYIMATSRFAHYLKIMARDKIGSFMEVSETTDKLNRWILSYVNANKNSKQELKAKYPLAEARIEIREASDNLGAYEAVAWLRPWLQMEELTTSLRLVAKIPKDNKQS